MFDENKQASSKEPEDILAGVDDVSQPNIGNQNNNMPPFSGGQIAPPPNIPTSREPAQSVGPIPPKPPLPQTISSDGGDYFKYILWGIIVLIIVGSGFAIWYYFATKNELNSVGTNNGNINFSVNASANNQRADGNINLTNENINSNLVNSPENTNRAPSIPGTTEENGTLLGGEENIIDSDQDGLSDEEESRLRTNRNKVDTDDDDLTDREEVRVYKTDPRDSDTDGDGYLDGEEVKSGYDPRGPGKLYQLP